tara:strand:+ start:172 stop:465 length:294 start_codon:yes stop_codon:yes gene_type:complete
MNTTDLSASLFTVGLRILGGFHLDSEETNRFKVRSIVLVGPKEPLFWKKFKASKEYKFEKESPLDIWSKRVIESISKEYEAKAFYPFEGPTYMPFYQ